MFQKFSGFIFVSLCVIGVINASTNGNFKEDDFESTLRRNLSNSVKTGRFSSIPTIINQAYESLGARKTPEVICPICRAAADVAIHSRKSGSSKETVYEYLSQYCSLYGFVSNKTCSGFLDINTDTLLYIIDNSENVTGEWVCSVSLQQYNCHTSDDRDWSVDVQEGYSAPRVDKPSSHTFNILHISDIHYDPFYEAGRNSFCGEAVCCGSDLEKPKNKSIQAGYWGDYNPCDTPIHSLVDAFNQIKNNHHFDYIYFTGDIVHHRAWLTSPENIKNDIRRIHRMFDDTFKGSKIFPTLGNHDPHPANLFAPHGVEKRFSSQWFYDFLAEEWGKWLPTSTQETIRRGGFYTVKVTDKFRVISLNNNVCYLSNFWLFYDSKDYYGQLKWLQDVLAQAEADGELVHIISHVPTGNGGCHSPWAREYRRITNRYANNIKASFVGHLHTSELQLFYNITDPTDPTVISFNGGSLTTFRYLNPNYFLYEVNNGTMEVVDAVQYTYNLTAANLAGSDKNPHWFKLFSFKDVYGLKDMSLKSLDGLVKSMAANKTMARLYYKNKFKYSDPYLARTCEGDCLLNHLCYIVTSWDSDQTQCNVLKDIWTNYS